MPVGHHYLSKLQIKSSKDKLRATWVLRIWGCGSVREANMDG